MILWFDGFDHYGEDEAKLTQGVYSQAGAAFTLSTANPRTGTHCLRRDASSSTDRVTRLFGAAKTGVGSGFAASLSALPAAGQRYDLASFVDSTGTDQIGFGVDENGALLALSGGTGTVIATSSAGAVSAGEYNHIEIAATANNEDFLSVPFFIDYTDSSAFTGLGGDYSLVDSSLEIINSNGGETLTTPIPDGRVTMFSTKFTLDTVSLSDSSSLTAPGAFIIPRIQNLLPGDDTLRRMWVNGIPITSSALALGTYTFTCTFSASSMAFSLVDSDGNLIASGAQAVTQPLISNFKLTWNSADPESLAGANKTYWFDTVVVYRESDSPNGIVEARVNGATVLSGAGLETIVTGESTYSGMSLKFGSSSAHGVTTDIDDWFIWSTDGAWNTSFLGDRRCFFRKPNQDTLVSDFSKSAGSFGYKLIDDESPDDDSTYIVAESSMLGGSPLVGSSEFLAGNLPSGCSSISAVNILPRSSKTDIDGAEIYTAIVSGVYAVSADPVSITTSYAYYPNLFEYDPATVAPFTRESFNNAIVSINASIQPPAPFVLPPGYIAHYDMMVSGATLIDEAGNYDRTIVGATSGSDASGDFLSFDGIDDGVYGDLDAAQKTQEFSYSILFTVAAYPASGSKALVSLEPTGTYLNARGAALSINSSGNLVARFGNTATSSFVFITSVSTVALGTLTSATVTFNAGTGTLFIGTTNEGTNSSIGTIEWTDSGSGPSPGQFYLGAERNNTAGVLPNAAFAAVKQYDYIEYPRELSSADIAILASRA